jgi:hypothetical protein
MENEQYSRCSHWAHQMDTKAIPVLAATCSIADSPSRPDPESPETGWLCKSFNLWPFDLSRDRNPSEQLFDAVTQFL